ncbi:hypothetical protein A2482_04615 [Candidatus Falkowbacteria bacterium RIFOXYC2_FULL_48_21]|uniref:Uncharacterized protein n=1 Tax=Candidatus Falkowbacteria bacterium RIFOXYC2_FULL_48_21 TaxID=1798005 RepID=A0A1F5T648_9BACT|nr:MAG: hypothetical protein A2482_04615 [Candidatus Falkowbacteria bacterium RIFOXYC2_FULL_48_21]
MEFDRSARFHVPFLFKKKFEITIEQFIRKISMARENSMDVFRKFRIDYEFSTSQKLHFDVLLLALSLLMT